MKYLLLIQQGDTPTPGTDAWGRLSAGRAERCLRRVPGRQRDPRRHARRVDAAPGGGDDRSGEDGKTLTTDGPFVAIKEALGGYLFYEADDLDAAIELASRIPAARMGGAVEVRPRKEVLTILEQVFRDEWGRVLASLIGFLGDFDLAEEAAQEAFAIAAERWPREGTPSNPRAWLVTTARNRAVDRIRRDRTLHTKLRLLDVQEATEDDVDETTIPDERLELIFTCCHPALALEAQVALTLRSLGGLDTRGDRACVPRPGRDDGQTARPGQAEDQGGRHPVPGAAGSSAPRPPGGGARGRVPDLQRGLRRTQGSRR